MRRAGRWAAGLLVLATTAIAGDFTWTTNGNEVTLAKYTGTGGEVEIPAAVDGRIVAAIGPDAFADCAGLTRVAIPDSVVRIGDQAFAYCTGLTNVSIGRGVASIGQWAFHGCDRLADLSVDALNPAYGSVDGALYDRRSATLLLCPARKAGAYAIPSGIVAIANEAFAHCAGLTDVAIPESLVRIGDWAFDSSGLAGIQIPGGVTQLGVGAFSACANLARVEGGAGLVQIGRRAFERSGLIGFAMSNGVTQLGSWAFYGCPHLARVQLSENLSRIEERTFFDCTALTALSIPASVVSIGDWAFAECPGLKAIYYQGNAPEIGEETFTASPSVVQYYLSGKSGWGSALGGRPAMPGEPPAETNAPARRTVVFQEAPRIRSGASMAEEAGF